MVWKSWWPRRDFHAGTSYGGNLVLFFYKDRETIRCAQISLERRHQGRSEIWGKIDWCDDVLFRSDDLFVTKTLDVIL